MAFNWGGLAGGIIGPVAGAVAGGLFGSSADSKAFDRQKWMASNAHQIEVADLKAAGLNPVLSGMGGTGASAPSVSNTVGGTAGSGAAAGASAARLAVAELDQMHAQAEAARASAAQSLALANESKRRSAAEYGTPGSVAVMDPRTGQMIGGRVPGLREQEVAANVELLKARAAEQGYTNVRAAAEAGVYKDFPMAVPLEMLIKAADSFGGAFNKMKK